MTHTHTHKIITKIYKNNKKHLIGNKQIGEQTQQFFLVNNKLKTYANIKNIKQIIIKEKQTTNIHKTENITTTNKHKSTITKIETITTNNKQKQITKNI